MNEIIKARTGAHQMDFYTTGSGCLSTGDFIPSPPGANGSATPSRCPKINICVIMRNSTP